MGGVNVESEQLHVPADGGFAIGGLSALQESRPDGPLGVGAGEGSGDGVEGVSNHALGSRKGGNLVPPEDGVHVILPDGSSHFSPAGVSPQG